ncbi:hypothetical protein J3R03_008365 [Actinoplanes couchii]|uniref:hypothetical protein n=1 Tax=Actinoplanes couchii TaxID=403638 RepID=UPI0028644F38|nr:hypothetical protein [Actinoplanes couchii]MDR6324169.1 hypothetical protein [Actinoplanes couchii]
MSAVPILQCADLDRTIAFYESLGFVSDRLSGYATFAAGDAEIHLSRTGNILAPGAYLIHVNDAAATRRNLASRSGAAAIAGRTNYSNHPLRSSRYEKV